MSAGPDISVVVPFYDSERHIRSCVESLLDQDGFDGTYELILVDNGSTDSSAAIVAEYPRVTVLAESTPGAYAARNRGIGHASAPLIAFTDADCVVAGDWLAAIREAMIDPRTAIVVGHCRYPARATLTLRLLGAYEAAKAEYVIERASSELHFAYGNNMAVRASVFAELGPFRRWRRAGDTELAHRLAARRPDLRLAYCPSMRVTQREFLSTRARLRRLRLYRTTNARVGDFRELDAWSRLRGMLLMLRRALTPK